MSKYCNGSCAWHMMCKKVGKNKPKQFTHHHECTHEVTDHLYTNASLKLLIKQANVLDLQMQEGLHVCVEQEENKYGYVECQHERVREHGVHDCTHWQIILTLMPFRFCSNNRNMFNNCSLQ